MPCRSDYMEEPRSGVSQAKYNDLVAQHNKLTAEADVLREAVLDGLERGLDLKVPAAVKKGLAARQTAHRKVDLKRLEETFIKSKDTERLAKVWAADPKKPLEPQLGFDPDAF